jgi:hypothetical protein
MACSWVFGLFGRISEDFLRCRAARPSFGARLAPPLVTEVVARHFPRRARPVAEFASVVSLGGAVASPPATQFVKPAGYVNQAPILGAPGK